MSNQNLINRLKSFKYTTAIIVVFIVAGIGAYLVTSSHAAAPYNDTTATVGALSGGASTQSCSSASSSSCVAFGDNNTSQFSISVSGNKFVNQNGQAVQLRGIDRSGTEYSCTDNYPYKFISDNGSGEGESLSYASTVASSLLSWNKSGATTNAINAVRVPLNEDCWLGINLPSGADPYIGVNYQHFIQAEVSALTAQHMYVILDLHLTAPGTNIPIKQDVAPDEDHAPTFWQQVADQYKNQPSVMFDLFNEPRMTQAGNWTCWQMGCTTIGLFGSFQTAGTQQLVSIIRNEGAKNVILVEGLSWADDFSQWVATAPHDCSVPSLTDCSTNPDPQIAPELHMYSYSTGNTITINGPGPGDYSSTPIDNNLASGGMSSKYPIYMGEFGEIMCSGTSNGFTADAMNWADAHGYSYTAWGWDSGQGCGGPSLVTNNDTGATSSYGAIVEAHLQSLEQ